MYVYMSYKWYMYVIMNDRSALLFQILKWYCGWLDITNQNYAGNGIDDKGLFVVRCYNNKNNNHNNS